MNQTTRILRLLNHAQYPMGDKEIFGRLDIPRPSVRRTISELNRTGQRDVVYVYGGYYDVTDHFPVHSEVDTDHNPEQR